MLCMVANICQNISDMNLLSVNVLGWYPCWSIICSITSIETALQKKILDDSSRLDVVEIARVV